VLRRVNAGKSPFSADRKHLHHRLLDMGHTHLHAVLIFYCWTAVASIGVLTFLFVPWWLSLIFIAIGFGITAGFTLAPLGARKRREAIAQNAKLTDPASQDVARLDPLDAAADPLDVDRGIVDAEAEVALGRLDTKRFDEKEAS
jgi:UDP-GlcNAc:undecaprenyl-phosphate GlcNAc-1-phosphate transferase